MTGKLKNSVEHWLREERRGSTGRAENALLEVFSRLPKEPVPDGFAERILIRAGIALPVVAERSWAAFWGVRAAISTCLVLIALFLVVIPGYIPALLGIFNLSRITEMGVAALVSVSHQLGVGLIVWRALSSAGGILSATLSSPQNLMVLMLGMLLSIGALRLLHDVLHAERSSRYVSSA